MVDWQTVKSLSFTFGPIVVPFLFGQYRKLRTQLATAGPPQPPPKGVYNALTLLWIAIAGLVVLSFPSWQPENIITLTSSRIQTPTNVMFERLKQFRPYGFTWQDETFQVRLNVPEGRALYMKFGPDAILNCYWCAPMTPVTYVVWLLPEVLGLHVVNFLVIGLATSFLIGGREASRWRWYASAGAMALAAVDVWYLHSYDWIPNMLAKTAAELDFFYWRMRTLRPLIIAGLDGTLALVLWLSSTGRLFAEPPSAAEKLDALTQKGAQTQHVLQRVAMVMNSSFRNNGLRSRIDEYWRREGETMQEVMQSPEVVQAVNSALRQRINLSKYERDAKTFVDGMQPVQITAAPS